MTAINAFTTAGAVHLLTDGLVGAEDVYGTIAKVMPLPHLNAALATRGPARLLGLMSLVLQAKTSTFADVVHELGRLQAICDELSEPWQVETLRQEFDLCLVGIGEEGPSIRFVSNHGRHGTTPQEVLSPQILVTPPVGPELFNRFAAADDRLAIAVEIIEAQRADPVVGGFAQLTTVTASGIETRIVRHWGSAVPRTFENLKQ